MTSCSSGFSFPTGGTEAQGDLCLWCCAGLEKGQCGQHMAASLTLLMQSVFISVVQGVLQSHPCFLGFSQWCFLCLCRVVPTMVLLFLFLPSSILSSDYSTHCMTHAVVHRKKNKCILMSRTNDVSFEPFCHNTEDMHVTSVIIYRLGSFVTAAVA